jgi:hypothetical protein
MIRPEPPGANTAVESSRFWDGRYAGPGRVFSVGNVVRFDATDPPPDFPYPHATEDRIVVTGTTLAVCGQLQLPQIALAVARGVSSSMPRAFDGALVTSRSNKAYVPAGQVVRSLGAIEVAADQINLYEESYRGGNPKLRAMIRDGNLWYDLSVPADAARSRWKTAGLAALQADLRASGRVHVRVGLSRPFAAMPDQCYAQVNGLYLL